MATSFPFLKIAREHGVPYGSVVRMTEAIPKMIDGVALTDQEFDDTELYQDLINEILNATIDEIERRRGEKS